MSTTANKAALLRSAMLLIGAVLLPAGLLVIGLGWYGAAHTPYAHEQTSYLISGGMFGLGLTFVGGFLYFGGWLAKASADNADAMATLTRGLHELNGALLRVQSVAGAAGGEASEQLVATAAGTMHHRPDCTLVAGRQDLRTVADDLLQPCRLCLG